MWGNFLSLEDLDGDTLCKPWQRALRGFQEEGECSVKSSRALTWTSWSWPVGCWWSLLRSSLSHSSSSSGSSWPPDNRQIQTLLDFLVWYCIVGHNSHKKIFCDNFCQSCVHLLAGSGAEKLHNIWFTRNVGHVATWGGKDFNTSKVDRLRISLCTLFENTLACQSEFIC